MTLIHKIYLALAGDTLGGAILFYSKFPWPPTWPVSFERIARWITLVGLLVGTILSAMAWVLERLEINVFLQAGILVTLAIALTGGLHLDGVADSGDGLAVTDPRRRLEVMRDSQTGAYGVMAIAVVLLLKTLALGSLTPAPWRSWSLLTALVWGRWGQLLAIVLYPYVRKTGKGAMHRQQLKPGQDLTMATLIALVGPLAIGWWWGLEWAPLVSTIVMAGIITWGVGLWFARQFGGHTGDTYGAVVEWSETLILLGLNFIFPLFNPF